MEAFEPALLIIMVVITMLYLLMIMVFTIGWFTVKQTGQPEVTPSIKLSVIVPARNEEDNISACLTGILSQSYPPSLYEIIVIDDHSDDQTHDIAMQYAGKANNLSILRLPENLSGKKQALDFGISNAKNDVIITTDADCSFHQHWLSTIASYWHSNNMVMASGPVVFNEGKSLFQRLQSVEFLSLIASGAGSVASGIPILCNGANLVFSKKAYYEVDGYKRKDYLVSGDDVFLMLKMRKKFGNKTIGFIKSYYAIVYTAPQKSLGAFLEQRVRWISKSRGYTNFEIIATSLIVYLFNYSIFMALALGMWSSLMLKTSFVLFLVKVFADLPLYAGITAFARKNYLLWYLFPMQIFYVFYVSFMGFAGNFLSFKWKGRKGK